MTPKTIANIFDIKAGNIVEITFLGNASRVEHKGMGVATDNISYDIYSGTLLRQFKDVYIPSVDTRINVVWVPVHIDQLQDFKLPRNDAY